MNRWINLSEDQIQTLIELAENDTDLDVDDADELISALRESLINEPWAKEAIEEARKRHCNDNDDWQVQIDDDARFSEADEHVWVMAWAEVKKEDLPHFQSIENYYEN